MRQQLYIRLATMPVVAILAGTVWWIFNQDLGNLQVVDHYLPVNSPAWWGAAIFMVSLSLFLLIVQLLVQARKEDSDDDSDAPPMNRFLVGVMVFLCVAIDLPGPTYGFWLYMGWPADMRHILMAFGMAGVLGSTVAQLIAVGALVDTIRVAGYLLRHPARRTKQARPRPLAAPIYTGYQPTRQQPAKQKQRTGAGARPAPRQPARSTPAAEGDKGDEGDIEFTRLDERTLQRVPEQKKAGG